MIYQELKIIRENEKNKSTVNCELKMMNNNNMEFDPTQIKLEMSLLQRKFEILEERELQVQKLFNRFKNNAKNSKDLQLFLSELNIILNSKSTKK